MTGNHPIHLHVERTTHFARVHVLIRVALLLAIGTIGCASIYWLLYLALPALVAIVVMQKGGARYVTEDTPRIVRLLRWLVGAYAYLWLLTDALPTTEPSGPVELDVEVSKTPTAGSALLRLLSSLPALIVAAILAMAAALVWLVGAIVVLVKQEMPAALGNFMMTTLRYQTRLAGYHLSLVERYPTLEESPAVHAPA